jgi:excisionase family DNA binding protein
MERRGYPRALAAEYLGISPSFFSQLVRDGSIPGPKRIGARVVWDRYDLDEYFDNLPRDGEANDWEDVINGEA